MSIIQASSVETISLEDTQEVEEFEYCNICCASYPVNKDGDIQCECAVDPYLADSSKELDFND